MSTTTTLKDIFDRWGRVWHEGKYDLIPSVWLWPISDMMNSLTGR